MNSKRQPNNRTISCVIVEDEPLAQKLLEGYIAKVPTLELKATFTAPIEASVYLHKQPVDLIFLDIEMQEINGMEFLETLNEQPQVIFTTAYSHYAVESYEKNALDYLLKPIKFERFLRAVNKLSTQTEAPNAEAKADFIYVKSDRQLIKLYHDDIYFIKSMSDYVVFHTENNTYIVHHALKKLVELLPAQFLRVHYSYIINLDKVEKLQDNHLHIQNEPIPIGVRFREVTMQQLRQWLI